MTSSLRREVISKCPVVWIQCKYCVNSCPHSKFKLCLFETCQNLFFQIFLIQDLLKTQIQNEENGG